MNVIWFLHWLPFWAVSCAIGWLLGRRSVLRERIRLTEDSIRRAKDFHAMIVKQS